MSCSATVRWSSVELVRLPRLLSVMDARDRRRGHGQACTPAELWRSVLVRPVLRSKAQKWSSRFGESV
jgi:hypothetical protein